jgi:hypothetical protein
VAVKRKPVLSLAPAPARGRKAAAARHTLAGHRPRRRGTGEGTIPGHRPVRAPLRTAPAAARHLPMRGRRAARHGVGQLLSVFLAATLVMVAAVIVVGIVGSWWVLVPVMLVDFAATFGVVVYIARLLADEGESPT